MPHALKEIKLKRSGVTIHILQKCLNCRKEMEIIQDEETDKIEASCKDCMIWKRY